LGCRLRERGIFLRTGPFVSHLRTRIPRVIEGIHLLYGEYPLADGDDFADFHIALIQPNSIRRWIRRQVLFQFDGESPFKPLPIDQALPLLEWGQNWSIGNHAHQYLIIHAAAIERGGRAVILPGPPGSGKSTLCAYLVHNGWRLLSDELALLSLDKARLTALARPISLKNESIEIIKRSVPNATLSRASHDTIKGTVALLKAPPDSTARVQEFASPAWVIFPKYASGAKARLEDRSKADTFIEVGKNSFNYSIHGKNGFDCLARLIDACDCYDFTYSDLNEALSLFAALEPPGLIS